jgi:hypothetical protein
LHFREGDVIQAPSKMFQRVAKTDGDFCREAAIKK